MADRKLQVLIVDDSAGDADLIVRELRKSFGGVKVERVNTAKALKAALQALRASSIRVAIDDFGTGHSSLAYLARLPVDTLKIDRSFIITMLDDPNTMTLVQTIVSLAHSLKLAVVAEGVDPETQANILRLLRCDQMQGYLVSKPVPLPEITVLLGAP